MKKDAETLLRTLTNAIQCLHTVHRHRLEVSESLIKMAHDTDKDVKNIFEMLNALGNKRQRVNPPAPEAAGPAAAPEAADPQLPEAAVDTQPQDVIGN